MSKYFLVFHDPTGLYVGGMKLNHRNELCADLTKTPILFPVKPQLTEYSFEGDRSFYTPANEFVFEEIEVDLDVK